VVLGFDFGARRIGAAIGNVISRSARAVDVVANSETGPDWPRLDALLREWRPDALLVGLPLMLDDSEQRASRAARAFADELQERYRLPVMLVDERHSSQEAARRFAREENYGAWGWEIHHAAKKDSPSGTLLALAEEMACSGYQRPVSLSANRAGWVPGTHEIGFDSAENTITLRHEARGREGFASGALRAARWLADKKGFFEFREIADELP